MEVKKWKTCPDCGGSGVGEDRDLTEKAGSPNSLIGVCKTCGGKGKVPDSDAGT